MAHSQLICERHPTMLKITSVTDITPDAPVLYQHRWVTGAAGCCRRAYSRCGDRPGWSG